MKILSFDPGKTTGYAAGVWKDGRSFDIIASGEILWDERFEIIRNLVYTLEPDYTVIESFRLYRHKAQDQIGNDFPSAQVIGTIHAYLHTLGKLSSSHLQPAALRKSVAVLPEHTGAIGNISHRIDAYQHLRYFIIVTLPKLV